ncbi:MAG TPA: glycosyltransferase family 4 protein [Ktedonobacterales bacterium]|nr:glycosyltransferase family 4 protein [Ktedonobacterales bacterium]
MGSGNKIRVLAITSAYPTPGSHKGAFLQSEVEGLREQGIDVTVMHLQGRMKYLSGAWRSFWSSIGNRYDILHGHYSFCGAVARAQVRLPTVITFWGSDVLRNPALPDTRASQFSRRISPRLARMADACIVPSQEMANALPGARMTIVPQGVNFKAFRPISQEEARHALGLNPDLNHRYVLFCANPALPVKGYPIAEAAVNLLRRQEIPVELLAVTGQPHDTVIQYMNACDVLALPSFWEGGPYVVKEAMACNLPIVATDVGDVAIVTGNTQGCYIAERTPEDFADKLWRSLRGPRRTTGRQDIAHLSRENATAHVIAVYDDVLRRRGRKTSP